MGLASIFERSATAQTADKAEPGQVCVLKVSGMACGACARRVEGTAKKIEGVKDAKVFQPKGTVEIMYDPAETTPGAIANTVTEKMGFKAAVARKETRPGIECAEVANGSVTEERRPVDTKRTVKRFVVAVVVSALGLSARAAFASGYGPVFGMTTPTNVAGGWSVDIGLMGRTGEDDNGAMTRAMLSYGFTEDLQLSVSAPLVFASAPLPPARGTAMMPGSGDFEGILAWRFHRRGTGVGTRVESTAYGGLIVPGPQKPAGMVRDLRRALGVYTAVASGIASRSHDVWGGIAYTWFAEVNGDQRPEMFSYSAVWGYRPPPLRKEYPHWDWRVFVEMTGEKSGNLWRAGTEHVGTGGHQIFLGPTALGIYKNYAIEGGVQVPVYRNVGASVKREPLRYAVNFSYFF